jgi:ParB-like chromosome segregation protein Spo0J
MKIELRLLMDIVPYAKDLRKISQKAIDKVALSIAEFGSRQPIVVDGAGVIIVGTVRYLASKKLGLESFPVHVAEGLTPAQVRGYRINDNRSHEETDWDLDIVKLEINELDALKFDLKFTGFEPRELDEFLATPMDNDAENSSPTSKQAVDSQRLQRYDRKKKPLAASLTTPLFALALRASARRHKERMRAAALGRFQWKPVSNKGTSYRERLRKGRWIYSHSLQGKALEDYRTVMLAERKNLFRTY